MARGTRTVKCGTHGETHPAFVCAHLAFERSTPLGFFAPELDPSDPDLQAWCAQCEKALCEIGDWSDEMVEQAYLTVVCEFCYESIRAFHGRTA